MCTDPLEELLLFSCLVCCCCCCKRKLNFSKCESNYSCHISLCILWSTYLWTARYEPKGLNPLCLAKVHLLLLLGACGCKKETRAFLAPSVLLSSRMCYAALLQQGVLTSCDQGSSRLSLIIGRWDTWSLVTLKSLKLKNFCDVSVWLHCTWWITLCIFSGIFWVLVHCKKYHSDMDTPLFLGAVSLPCHFFHVTESSDTQPLIPWLVSDMP